MSVINVQLKYKGQSMLMTCVNTNILNNLLLHNSSHWLIISCIHTALFVHVGRATTVNYYIYIMSKPSASEVHVESEMGHFIV